MFPQPPCHCVLILFTFVQLVHQSQVLRGKREVPNLEKHIDRSRRQLVRNLDILLLSLSLAGLWQKSNAQLQAPAQEHLLVLDYNLSFEDPCVKEKWTQSYGQLAFNTRHKS